MIINPNDKFIDVICQYTKEGQIIPLRLRFQDEDGLYQIYNVKGYKELSRAGKYKTPYGTISHTSNWRFLCQIQVLSRLVNVELFFNSNDNLWKIVSVS